jgi:hypothetical protein
MPTTLLDALDDRQLLGTAFASPSWDSWRAFCRALYGLPMPPAQLELFRRCTGRSDAPMRAASEAWVVCGRRSGKSRSASAVATYVAALAPTTTLAPGDRAGAADAHRRWPRAPDLEGGMERRHHAPGLRADRIARTPRRADAARADQPRPPPRGIGVAQSVARPGGRLRAEHPRPHRSRRAVASGLAAPPVPPSAPGAAGGPEASGAPQRDAGLMIGRSHGGQRRLCRRRVVTRAAPCAWRSPDLRRRESGRGRS